MQSLSSCLKDDEGQTTSTFWLDLSHNLFTGDFWQFLSCTSGLTSLDASHNTNLTTLTVSALVPNLKLMALDVGDTAVCMCRISHTNSLS